MQSDKERATAEQCSKSSSMETIVAIAQSLRPDYGTLAKPVSAPELPCGEVTTVAQAAVRKLFQAWGLDAENLGSRRWNPLGEFMPPGSRVVLKPNWVLHRNKSGQGLDCLLTHTSLIEAVLQYVGLTHPASVIVGDAPVQGCDFGTLRRACGLDTLAELFRSRGMEVSIIDFRRTCMMGEELGAAKIENRRAMENYVLFDLKEESLLEPLSVEAEKFRVTMYDPDFMRKTHAMGRHKYLIAREVIKADVIINLPKLKCHKKACITGALKNLVGINGSKEYLPHHRKGGSAAGGDCYAGASWLKRRSEGLMDAANRRRSRLAQYVLAQSAGVFRRCGRLWGLDNNLEGSWYGNDTLWRTCLDLQRIVRYGREDANLDIIPQRTIISITDAIIAGEGEGPMAPAPVPSGFVTGALNPAAAEWIHARLMGFDPNKIPLIQQAFIDFRYRLATFKPTDIRVRIVDKQLSTDEVRPFFERAFTAPKGWKGYCELDPDNDRRVDEPTLVA